MSADFEIGQQGIRELADWANQHDRDLMRNEAETRLHLIDSLLFDCLGWGKEDCSVEASHNGSYADYILGIPERLALIEAKREGKYFEVPAGFAKRTARLSLLASESQNTFDALKQALGYCQERGIGVGAICNGHQLIIFLASRQDGVPPLEGSALIFYSIEDMREAFRTLWDGFSKPGITARNIYTLLKGLPIQPPPQKLAQRLNGYPGFKGRNAFQTELEILGGVVIEDLSKSPEFEKDFLERCYCTSGALSQYALISKQILHARYSSLLQQELHLPNMQAAASKSGLNADLASDLVSAAITQRPVILLGDVGVGKTIFLRHLITVEAPDVLGKALVLYIDFGSEPALATDLEDFVLRRSAAQLHQNYGVDIDEDRFVRGVYHFELKRFEQGIFAPLKELDHKAYLLQEIEFLAAKKRDVAAHLRSSLDHISKARCTQIVMFLDNIDQRHSNFQEQVFLIAQSLAATWPATVFVCLRPDTFAMSSVKGSLSAYHPRVFTVSPPRVDLVIKKRLVFAQDELSGTGRLHSLPPQLTISSPLLSEYLHILIESFEDGSELMEFIDNLSGGNTRQAIEFLSDFIGSGHVDSQQIIDIYHSSGSYKIPVHQFLRAIIYRDNQHYDPTESRVANLFDISMPDGREHFLTANLISFIERSSGTDTGNEGYVELDRAFDFGQGLGFQPTQIRFALDRCLGKKLLEANPKFGNSLIVTSARITTIGAYTVKRLSGMFSYVDAMIVDTPIVQPQVSAKIRNISSISDRIDRATIFQQYLDEEWVTLKEKPIAFDWAQASEALTANIRRVTRGAAKRLL